MFGLTRLGQHSVPAGLHHRGQQDGVHALGDEGADGADLVFLTLLGVGHAQVDAPLLGLFTGHAGLGGAPAGLRSDLGEADHYPIAVLPLAASGDDGAGEGGDAQFEQGLHGVSLLAPTEPVVRQGGTIEYSDISRKPSARRRWIPGGSLQK